MSKKSKKKIKNLSYEIDMKTTEQQAVAVKKEPPKTEATPFKWWKNEAGELNITFNHDEVKDISKFNEMFGVKDSELANHILNRGERALSPFLSKEESCNVIAQSLHDFRPQDAVESRLVVQAATAFVYAMNSMRVAGNSDMLCHTEPMINLAVKLMRVHNESIETLSRYRRGGEQPMLST
jgi:hypothetical protein